jgi:hypothetical protein
MGKATVNFSVRMESLVMYLIITRSPAMLDIPAAMDHRMRIVLLKAVQHLRLIAENEGGGYELRQNVGATWIGIE